MLLIFLYPVTGFLYHPYLQLLVVTQLFMNQSARKRKAPKDLVPTVTVVTDVLLDKVRMGTLK